MNERKHLPDTRASVTRKLTITHPAGALDVYVTVGLYEDGKPGELFIKADRMGSTISGLLDALAISISIGLQSGVPLAWYTSKLQNMRFEPSGATNVPEIKIATSIVDAIARWLEQKFGKGSQC